MFFTDISNCVRTIKNILRRLEKVYKVSSIDNLHYRLIFDLGKSRQKTEITGKKLVKFQDLVAKCYKIQPCEVRKFSILLRYVWKLLPFFSRKFTCTTFFNQILEFYYFYKVLPGIYGFLPRSKISL
jgi:hypothetical protein